MCAARATRGGVYLGRLQHSLHRTNLYCSCDSIHWRKSLRTQWSCHMQQNCSGTSWLGIMLCFINESALVFSWRDGPALGSNREAAVLITHKALQCCWWGQIRINVSNLHTQQWIKKCGYQVYRACACARGACIQVNRSQHQVWTHR